jgi:signal transduction histidine kinase
MARVHQQALGELLCHPPVLKVEENVLKAAETLLLEALSPFEAGHRGFREMNDKLQERNREMETEIKERKRAENALRQSETHYHRLFNEAQAMQESLRDLSNQILQTQEAERKRISRELHDEVGQSLTAISVALTTSNSTGVWNSGDGSQNLPTQSLLQRP